MFSYFGGKYIIYQLDYLSNLKSQNLKPLIVYFAIYFAIYFAAYILNVLLISLNILYIICMYVIHGWCIAI